MATVNIAASGVIATATKAKVVSRHRRPARNKNGNAALTAVTVPTTLSGAASRHARGRRGFTTGSPGDRRSRRARRDRLEHGSDEGKASGIRVSARRWRMRSLPGDGRK
ncbi:hypothetical protein NN561_020245 [Cricetulus griseus]